jgi:hypothetical protein
VIATDSRPGSLRRILTTAAVAAVLPLGLSACTSAATDFIYTPAQGVNDRSSDVDVLNALIVSGEEGEGRFIAGLANNTDEADEITGVAGAGEDEGVSVEFGGGDTEVPADGFLQLADEGAAEVTVSGEDVAPGTFIRLSIQFGSAEPVEMHVPVVSPGEDFSGVVSSTPSESPTESPTEAESEAATESESESPTEAATEAETE